MESMVESKAEKKARKKREREQKQKDDEDERSRKRLARENDPSWPLINFCEKLDDFPWNENSNNWGFQEGSEEFKMLSTKVPSPNDKILKVRGLADYPDINWKYRYNHNDFCGFTGLKGESPSEEDLPPDFTYNDVAVAIREASYGQGAGGHICHVKAAAISKVDPTVLEVIFDISCFVED